jgi:lysophospholipase L1-like esterase
MNTILCYGDSNTWGWNPKTTERYPIDEIWTAVLAKQLGPDWKVVAEGLNGRTTVLDDPVEDFKNGKAMLLPCLESHKPLDCVILMLGTNDLKYRFNFSAFDIAEGVGYLINTIKTSSCGRGNGVPQILLLAPAPIREVPPYVEMFRGGKVKSEHFKQEFTRIGLEHEVPVIMIEELTNSSPLDGIHLTLEGHQAIGREVAKQLKLMI